MNIADQHRFEFSAEWLQAWALESDQSTRLYIADNF
jgi:hypothetical protein